MKIAIDQMGRKVNVPQKPQRIVSLVPSQTELLFSLGLEQEVVGITKFCIHPEDQFKAKPKIGGTKNFRFEAIDGLKPDLIIGNKEENYQEGIEKLAQQYPVWMSDITTIEDACQMIASVADLVGKAEEGRSLVAKIKASFSQLATFPKRRTAYFIWKKPYMVAGRGTFINEVMQLANLENCIIENRYPEISLAELSALKPELILLSSEPFPFQQKHIPELQEACPEAEIRIVDGEMFSWYGSRLLKTTQYLKQEFGASSATTA